VVWVVLDVSVEVDAVADDDSLEVDCVLLSVLVVKEEELLSELVDWVLVAVSLVVLSSWQ
jgi:hypothetical protein